jgi:chitin disaccharide deacetylase
MTRRLVVNADDFGLSAGVNAGIAHSHRCGIVTSASLMVWQPAAGHAAALAATMPELSVGLHLDLGEWRACGSQWDAVYQRAPLDDAGPVAAEVDAQLARFGDLMGRPPTHLDSHQHVHRHPVVCEVTADRAQRLGVPLRECSDVAYVGGFYGQDGRGGSWPELLSAESLRGLLSSLAPGWSELGCHPGFAEDTDSVYRDERRLEVEALCDPALRPWLEAEGIALARFGDLVDRCSERVDR